MNLQDKVMELLSKVSGKSADGITRDQGIFGSGLNLDSLSGVNLITGINKEFGVSMDDFDMAMDSLDSVGSLMDFLSKHAKGSDEPAANVQTTTRSAISRQFQVLRDVAAASRLREGQGGVERILAAISGSPGLTSRELAAACALPTPTVAAVRKEMVKAGLIEGIGKGARLSPAGEALARSIIVGGGRESRSYSDYLQPKNLTLLKRLEELLEPLFVERPPADTSLDQAKCLPGTSAARAILAMEYGVLAGRNIAFMGDDDFTSIALGMLGLILAVEGKYPPSRLTVFDIDERILGEIADMAGKNSLPVYTVEQDMREPLPPDELGLYDAFFTDPPYTPEGAELFVSRGVSACRGKGSLGFFSFASKGPEDMFRVHTSFNNMGLLVREIMPGFNRYEGASLWGNQSQMVVIEGVEPQPAVGIGSEHGGPIYTAEFRKNKAIKG